MRSIVFRSVMPCAAAYRIQSALGSGPRGMFRKMRPTVKRLPADQRLPAGAEHQDVRGQGQQPFLAQPIPDIRPFAQAVEQEHQPPVFPRNMVQRIRKTHAGRRAVFPDRKLRQSAADGLFELFRVGERRIGFDIDRRDRAVHQGELLKQRGFPHAGGTVHVKNAPALIFSGEMIRHQCQLILPAYKTPPFGQQIVHFLHDLSPFPVCISHYKCPNSGWILYEIRNLSPDGEGFGDSDSSPIRAR